jgi:hypothetical protein
MEDAQSMSLIFDTDVVTTPGSENLYRNMFGLRDEQFRDIFQRFTMLERFHQKCRRKFTRRDGMIGYLRGLPDILTT